MNKVSVGVFIFLSVGPGDHAEYNRWHSYDHIPEFEAMPSEVRAQRYVATPDLIAARSPGDPAFAATQYFIAYYHQGVPEESLRERAAHNQWVVANTPNFTGKRALQYGGAFNFDKAYVAPRLRLSPEALLYRPHTGVHVTLSDVKDPSQAEAIEEWYERVHFPDMLSLKGFAGVWRFVSRGQPFGEFPNPRHRFLHVYFLDEDPTEAVADLRAKLPGWWAAGRGLQTHPRPLVTASTFRTIAEGKDQKYNWFDR